MLRLTLVLVFASITRAQVLPPVLQVYRGPVHATQSVSALADINGDGVDEFIVGEPFFAGPFTGRVVVVSGADGRQLHRFASPATSTTFGSSVADAGDADGDGVHDIVVGAFGGGAFPPNGSTSSVSLYSGRTGLLIRRTNGKLLRPDRGLRRWGRGRGR